MMGKNLASALLVCTMILFGCFQITWCSIGYDGRSLMINGKREILISGSIHYPRSTPDMWKDLILKAKHCGLNAIDTYVFWNVHEPEPGNYEFEGQYDLVGFIKTIQKAGLYSVVRIGPYICAEWGFGGFPVWLKNVPGMSVRTNNEPFKNAMSSFTEYVINLLKSNSLFEAQGGPIILCQIENEYGGHKVVFDADGLDYIKWAAELVANLRTGTPWIMCQQNNAPESIINSCNGFYCDEFRPNSNSKPSIWTEAWTGWFENFGEAIIHRPVEDLAFAVAKFIAKGNLFVNYYMFHGGTNFNNFGAIMKTTNYDYDAPLDEYGLIRQPKYGHLKALHNAIRLCNDTLLEMLPKEIKVGEDQQAFVYQSPKGCSAFLVNNAHSNARVSFQNTWYRLPPWSVSIFPDCKTEEFNTAKTVVKASTVIMMPTRVTFYELAGFTEKPSLSHSFRKDGILDQTRLIEQKTDYLWYQTDVSPGSISELKAISRGSALYAFVDGHLQGSAYGMGDNGLIELTQGVKVHTGNHEISLLSSSGGLPYLGFGFENWRMGVSDATLESDSGNNWNMTSHTWKYQVGLNGENLGIMYPKRVSSGPWSTLVGNKPLQWYKAHFDKPNGTRPLALDMKSMKKGQIWINGNKIGRYNILASSGSCNNCSYVGHYVPNKCLTGCGFPTQQWYHVPHHWLIEKRNLLVIFEEIGGDPTQISLVERIVK